MRRRKHNQERFALYLTASLALGLFFFTEGVSEERAIFGRAPYLELAAFWVLQASTWASLAPLVVSLARRFPIEGSRRAVHTFVHLGISVSLAALAAAAVSFVAPRPALGLTRRLSASRQGLTVAQLEGGFHQDLLAYWMVLGVHHALSCYRRAENRRRHMLQLKLEALQLRTRVADTQFAALRFRIHPSFLFTAITHTHALIRRQRREDAETMLSSLSDLLRFQLAHSDAMFVTLREEIELARLYLAVERLRLGDRLQVHVSADEDTLNLLVMPVFFRPWLELTIQTIVETGASTTVLRISGWRSGRGLRLWISFETDRSTRWSLNDRFETALTGIKRRLTILYGDAYELTVANDDETLAVTMALPCNAAGRRACDTGAQ